MRKSDYRTEHGVLRSCSQIPYWYGAENLIWSIGQDAISLIARYAVLISSIPLESKCSCTRFSLPKSRHGQSSGTDWRTDFRPATKKSPHHLKGALVYRL